MPTAAYKKAIFRCTDRSIALFDAGGSDSLFSEWMVTATWTANVGIVTGAVSLTSRLISINRGFQPYDFSVTKSYRSIELFGDASTDAQGVPTYLIENEAYDPPLDGLTTVKNISWIELELEYKEEYFDIKWLTTAFNTVNLFPIVVCDYTIPEAGGKVTLKDAKITRAGSGQVYWIVKLLIEMKEESWITEWLNAGFNQLDDSDKPVSILKKDVNPALTGKEGEEKISDEAKLDTEGKLLVSGADPVYNKDLTIFPQDWSVLDLPTSLKGN
jgi:hypothetical protein